MANEPTNPPPGVQASINWQALFASPFFWGLVAGVVGTIVVQQQVKKRIGGGAPRREPRLVNPSE